MLLTATPHVNFWTGVASGIVIGVVASVAVAYATGYLQEHGRRHAVRGAEKRRAKRAVADSQAAEAAAIVERDDAARRETEHIESLKRERVGRQFVRRTESRDDVGVLVTVIALGERAPKTLVLVENTAMPGGELPAALPRRLNMTWGALVAPASDQIHRTARINENSHDDSLGWVEFEEVTPQPGGA